MLPVDCFFGKHDSHETRPAAHSLVAERPDPVPVQKHPYHGYTALRIHAPKSNRALLDLGAAAAARGARTRLTPKMRKLTLSKDDETATLDDLREAVTTREMERTTRRAARVRRRPRSQRELIPACVSRE